MRVRELGPRTRAPAHQSSASPRHGRVYGRIRTPTDAHGRLRNTGLLFYQWTWRERTESRAPVHTKIQTHSDHSLASPDMLAWVMESVSVNDGQLVRS